MDPWRRVWFGLAALTVITAVGTLGFVLFGFGVLDALYQTITTISTVGFREYGETDAAWKLTTLVVILVGTGANL